jgi:hypothetical protein
MLTMTGTGTLAGFNRVILLPAACESHTGPRLPYDPVQSFDTDMFRIQGQIPAGDPDFDLLRITGGTSFGMPSPGHTTLTRQPSGTDWSVDSFFDITYRIDFVGAPGGPLAGRSGSTTATIRMQTGDPTTTGVGDPPKPLTKLQLSSRPNPFGAGTTVEFRLPNAAHVSMKVFDAAGHLVRLLADDRLPAGPHAQMWDGRSDAGKRLGSGTYFIKLAVDGKTVATRKATIIR